MMVIQDHGGGVVVGSYTHKSGLLAGKIEGNALAGVWSQTPTRKPPNDEGEFEFTLSTDGKSFVGRWRYGTSGAWHADWSGTKT